MYMPTSTVRKMLKDAGAGRISEGALQEFQKSVDKMAFGVAQRAVKLSKHAKRKTIDASDIKLAVD